jgi:hypothetical protein
MAMLLVLMLIVMVTAAGVFASQSTALEVRSAGFMRQAGQTHYVAETGVVASLEQMRQSCSAYLGVMQRRAQGTMPMSGFAEVPLQYRFFLNDFDSRVAPGAIFAPPTGGGMVARTPGSFGIGLLEPGFVTTVSVMGLTNEPMFGYGIGGGRDLTIPMLAVEMTSNGLTRLQSVTDLNNNARSEEQARVIAQVPCL